MLVQQEIWRIVSEASRSGARVPLMSEAQRIANGSPASGFSAEAVADALVYAAVDCGVAFETRVVARPMLEVPGILTLVAKRRKRRSEKAARTQPTFAGVPIPATA